MTPERNDASAFGPLSKKGTARHYMPSPVSFAQPTRITNSSSREPLKVAHQQTRAGSDHSAILSKGWA